MIQHQSINDILFYLDHGRRDKFIDGIVKKLITVSIITYRRKQYLNASTSYVYKK